MKKNIAIIGLGKQGKLYFDSALNLQKKEIINLIGICDKNTDFLEKLDIEINDIKRIINIHLQIYSQLGFSINTEGFYDNTVFKAIQLRNIPDDYLINSQISEKISKLEGKFDYYSRFVQGAYEIFGQVVHISDIDNLGPNPGVVVINSDTTTWNIPKLQERLLSGFPTVILDMNRGFHLSHRQDFLPPDKQIRDKFNYMSVSGINIDNLYSKYILIMSDGKQGAIFVTNSQEYKNSCTIKFLSSKELPDRNKVTSILVIPFINDENIVLTKNQRGLDIPGGHLEDLDITFEDAAHREVMEETGVEIDNLQHIGTLESDYFGNTPDKLTYILIYGAKVKKINDYDGYMECSGREILNYKEFLLKYQGKMINKDLMRFLIDLSMKK